MHWVIFTEENRNPKLAERLAAELGGDILLFSPLESLSESDDPKVTYFEKMSFMQSGTDLSKFKVDTIIYFVEIPSPKKIRHFKLGCQLIQEFRISLRILEDFSTISPRFSRISPGFLSDYSQMTCGDFICTFLTAMLVGAVLESTLLDLRL